MVCSGDLRLRERPARFGLREIRLRLFHVGFVRPRIDDEEDIALVHHGPLGEGDTLDVSRNTRAYVDHVDRFEMARELVPVRDWTSNGRSDSHGRRRRWALRLLLLRGDRAPSG